MFATIPVTFVACFVSITGRRRSPNGAPSSGTSQGSRRGSRRSGHACGKEAEDRRALLVFADEAGFQLVPNLRRTWSPSGRRPVVRHRFRRDRLSVIGGLSVSPVAHRLHLHYDIHTKNIRQPEVCAFLRALLRSWRGPIIVLWDQGRIHRGAIIREFLAQHPRVRVEAFPAYAPELDPQEMAWAHTKARLANGAPSNRWELMAALVVALEQLRRSQVELRACIHESELPWS